MASPKRDYSLDSKDVNWCHGDTSLEEDIKNKLRYSSEKHYIAITEGIVNNSKTQLKSQNTNKLQLRKIFLIFFVVLLSVQMAVLIGLIFLQAWCETFRISDNILLTFMTAVFVETLGAVIAMVKFSFDNSQEVQILKIMNNAITGFQKFKE